MNCPGTLWGQRQYTWHTAGNPHRTYCDRGTHAVFCTDFMRKPDYVTDVQYMWKYVSYSGANVPCSTLIMYYVLWRVGKRRPISPTVIRILCDLQSSCCWHTFRRYEMLMRVCVCPLGFVRILNGRNGRNLSLESQRKRKCARCAFRVGLNCFAFIQQI